MIYASKFCTAKTSGIVKKPVKVLRKTILEPWSYGPTKLHNWKGYKSLFVRPGHKCLPQLYRNFFLKKPYWQHKYFLPYTVLYTSSTAIAHILDHLSLSWHNTNQFSTPIPVARTSFNTSSLHHFLAPWNGLLFNSSPNSNSFGKRSLLICPRWPNQHRHCLETKSAIDQSKPTVQIAA